MEIVRSNQSFDTNLEVPAGFADQVMARIHQEDIRPASRLAHPLRMAGVAAMLFISAGIGIWLGSGYDGRNPIGRSDQSVQEFREIHNLSSGIDNTSYYSGT